MATDLITLQEYKTYALINSTTQDAAIQSIIPKISSLVKQICRRTFVDYLEDYKIETVRSCVNNRILLSETPLTQIALIEFSEDYGKTYTTLEEFTDYVVDTDTNAVEFILPIFTNYNKVNAFRVTYNAGYQELPEDLKLAVLDLTAYYLRNDSAVHSSKSISPNTMQIEYVSTTNLPAGIKRVLDLYTAYYG
jgi:hypothetical protein